MIDKLNSFIQALALNGYAKGADELLKTDELLKLNSIIADLKNDQIKENSFLSSDKEKNLLPFLGKNKELDEIISKILANKKIKKIIESVVGKNYILKFPPVVRFSDEKDKGMYFHQDSAGETSFTFLLTDQKKGTTALIPGSHLLLPMKLKGVEFSSWVSPKLQMLTKYFYTPLSGLAGNYYFWFNRCFHGRLRSSTKQASLMFSFLPVGHPKNIEILDNLEDKIKNDINFNKIDSLYLIDLLSTTKFRKNAELFNNLPSIEKEIPICLGYNSFSRFALNSISFFSALIKVLTLELIFFPVYFFRILKKNKYFIKGFLKE